jgi:flavin-dependent dehydrogenase
MWNVHRADYQRVLYDAAVERGVTVRFDCRVESLNEDEPSVAINGGEVVKGDVIIGADGITPPGSSAGLRKLDQLSSHASIDSIPRQAR